MTGSRAVLLCLVRYFMTALTNALEKAARYFVLIPAAGVGSRMGTACPKQYLNLLGKPVLRRVLETFAACSDIKRIYVVVSREDGWLDAFLASWPDWNRARIVFLRCGGKTRRESVVNGLDAMLPDCAPDDWVLVHDAARPGVTKSLINHLIHAVADDPVGGLLGLPVVDTVKKQSGDTVTTISRDGLWLAQTPQMFRYALLRKALDKNETVTDEAGAVEAMGFCPRLVEGHPANAKVTRPGDMEWIGMLLTASNDEKDYSHE